MNIEDYKNINAEGVETISVNGKDHHMRISGVLDCDLLALMQDDDIKQNVKMVKFLCGVLCNAQGERIFDPENKEHFDIVKTLPIDVQTPLILRAQDIFFPKKKHQRKRNRVCFHLSERAGQVSQRAI